MLGRTSGNIKQIDVSKFCDYVPNVPLSPPNSEGGSDDNANNNDVKINGLATNKFSCRDFHHNSLKSPKKSEVASNFLKLYPNLLNNTTAEDTDFNNFVQKINPKVKSKYIYCNTCSKGVLIPNLKFHLIFGHLKCNKCGIVIKNCSDFKSLMMKFSFTKVAGCMHKELTWLDEPINSLHWLKDDLIEPNSFNISLLSYINKLNSLREIHPFNNALEECQDFLKLCEKSLAKSKEYAKSPTRKKSFQKDNVLKTNIKSKQKKSPKSYSDHSQRNAKRKNNTEQIKLPSDNFYLIVEQPLEVCPNCYECLNKKQFSFNTCNGLITTKCNQCSLVIYFVLKPPDGSRPKIKILKGLQ